MQKNSLYSMLYNGLGELKCGKQCLISSHSVECVLYNEQLIAHTFGWVTYVKVGTLWEKNKGTFHSFEIINICFVDIIKDVIKYMMHGINKKGFRKKSGSMNFVEKNKHNILWQLGWMKILLDEN
jgi:hypothetical protein